MVSASQKLNFDMAFKVSMPPSHREKRKDFIQPHPNNKRAKRGAVKFFCTIWWAEHT